MRKIILPLLVLCATVATAQLNIQFRGHLPYTGLSLANIGGYVDSLGNEYALVGYENGLDIVDVTVPTNPVVKFTVTGPTSEWREVKTYRKHAYVTTDGAGSAGLIIIDMSKLPDSIHTKNYYGDGVINGQIATIHALHIDTAKAFCYLYGSNISTGANTNGYPLILSLTDPWNPVYVANYIVPSGSAYVHDGYVQNDTAYYCHIYDGFVSIVDETNKSAPVLLATQYTPGLFTHNSWLSDDHKVMFTTDEKPNTYLTAYDISNMSNLTELSQFQTDPGSNAIVHNVHILNGYAVTSWYTEGVVIVDESRPANPIEVGHYNEYGVTSNGGTFHGDWGVYPFLPSGNLLISDIDSGFWVLAPTYVRGCYLEGIVTDSTTTAPIQTAAVQMLATTISKSSDILGSYAMGTVTAGTYSVQFSKPGYYTKTITGVSLNNGVLTTLNVQLARITIRPTANFTASATSSCTGMIQFTDSSTNLPTSWLWTFGDGGSSTQQNPSYVYTSNGNYTVTLIATNPYGTDTLTLANYISVNLPPSPIASPAAACSGSSAAIHASGTSVISWYANQFGGTALDTGSVYNTPALTSTTTYYVESDVYPAAMHDGPATDGFGTGSIFTASNYHNLYFDTYAPLTLISVRVYAQGTGVRTITLKQNAVTLQSAAISIPNGSSVVTLNFPVPLGTNFELGCEGTVNLYRNSGGSAYPYTVNGLVSITGDNSGATGYYYYFYDWIVQGLPCISARVPVTVTVAAPVAAFTSTIVDNAVSFAGSGGVYYFWTFGDAASGSSDTSTLANPNHLYSSLGSYQVCLVASNSGNGCSDTLCKTIVITAIGIVEIGNGNVLSVYPNPFSKEIIISSGQSNGTGNLQLKLTDVLGKVIREKTIGELSNGAEYKWNLSSVAAGAYLLVIENNDGVIETRKVVKVD